MTQLGFTLTAPGHFSVEQMLEIARYARQTAQLLGFQRVEPIIALEGEEVQQVLARKPELEGDWVHLVLSGVLDSLCEEDYELWAVHVRKQCLTINKGEDELPDIAYIPPYRIVGFHATGGRGCTELQLTFVQYPAEVYEVDNRLTVGWWSEGEVGIRNAYAYGEDHFVQCHLRHILLFKAMKRRFPVLQVKVSDPTHYWKSGTLHSMIRRARQLFGYDRWQECLQSVAQPAGTPRETEPTVIRASIDRDALRELLSRN